MMRKRQSLRHLLAALWICGFWLVSGAVSAGIVPASPSPHYVFDQPGWLEPGELSNLDATLRSYEEESSSQMLVAVFVAVPEGEEMVDFCQKVFEAWNPGKKDKDNGVILFIFANDRKLRVHTGYGLEGVLPDARCKQIIEEVITPRLREGRREAAVADGVRALIAATRGEYRGTGRTHGGTDADVPWLLIVFLVVVFLIVIFDKTKRGGFVVISGGGSRHDSWGGGWSGGGFSGGGGGGFSGGGGSSGGGGASGSW